MPEEKTHAATPSRVRRARREGDVARSAELNGVAALLAASLATFAIAPLAGAADTGWLRRAAHGDVPGDAALTLAALALVPIGAAGIGGALAGIAQSGGLVPRALKFDPSRLAPHEGVKRMFSRESAIATVRALLAVGVCALVLAPLAREVATLGPEVATPRALAALAVSALTRILTGALGVGAAFALVDVFVTRAAWLRRLRMSYDEVKRDAREQNGDPHLRQRRKQRHLQMARGGIAHVREASFVVVNPTHLAIALRYAPPEVPVPRVLVRAADDVALLVRTLARERGIPIIENVAVARALWTATAAGDPIPRDLYLAIAEIVAALMAEGAIA